MTIIVTGGAGFIGSNFVLNWFSDTDEKLINIDALTYAGNRSNLDIFDQDKRYTFIKTDINSPEFYEELFYKFKVRAVINFAAESHVDRSIKSPDDFIKTNINGTYNLLEVSKKYWLSLSSQEKAKFRFLHVSTDEVYGSLHESESPFTEENNYKPNSPYSASKASSDHLVRAYNKTYKLPSLITNCSNNYGPFQYPEKLIPLVINNALRNLPITVYGDGKQIRDWLYVDDHCNAIKDVLNYGVPFEVFNIGGNNEMQNIDIIRLICNRLDLLVKREDGMKYEQLIKYVNDRPGHDKRYAIDSNKIQQACHWSPKETFETGITKTVQWYLDNQTWVNQIYEKEKKESFLKK
ncbi:MAG: dTDP-glucose 4,6-dehydratase [Candidatus Marinimicrobia bacterium]|nr:dTDP-glucose 4,6-dehydratase [Candidatus Neomarinimicrobiota bacterium]|tara:strand:+ start:4414 stop:5466 length:1053 start_codon:yes stop_codon:yes gene_type:complete